MGLSAGDIAWLREHGTGGKADVRLPQYSGVVIQTGRGTRENLARYVVPVSVVQRYTPDARVITSALLALEALAGLPERKLERAVQRFVTRYGILANDTGYPNQLVPPSDTIPPIVRSFNPGGFGPSDRRRGIFPLEVYSYEGERLHAVLGLYLALATHDEAELERWYAKGVGRAWIHTPPGRVGWNYAWGDLVAMIDAYYQFLVVPRLTWPNGVLQPPPQLSMQASGILGLIYSQLAHWVTEMRTVKLCPCGAIFAPVRSDQIHCTSRCASNARSRRLRERRRANGLQTGTAK